jgi:hypothetical protein
VAAQLIGQPIKLTWPVKLALTRPEMFDSAGQRAAAKDDELDRHYETAFH